MEFGRKHLSDKFFIEGVERKNLRNIITREMIANTLIHREFTSSYTAKFVIEKERMYTENANRSSGDGIITPDKNDEYSYDNTKNGGKKTAIKNGDKKTAIKNGDKKISKKTQQQYETILKFMEEDVEYTIHDFCKLLGLKSSRTKEILKGLSNNIEQTGNNKNRRYRLK